MSSQSRERSPVQGPTFLPGSPTCCLLGTLAECRRMGRQPLGEGQGLGCAGACGGANLTLSPLFCSHTAIHTHAHIHAHIWTNDHTREGVRITLTKARTRSQKPLPSLWVSAPIAVRISRETQVLCSRWVGPRDTCRAVLASLGEGWGSQAPLMQASGKGVSLDDSTLLPLEGGAGGWSGQ